MTVNETLSAIEVMKAFTEGKQIQVRHRGGTDQEWEDLPNAHCPSWAWYGCEYRVKPEPPKPREYWIAIRKNGENPFPSTFSSREAAEKHICKVTDTWEVVHFAEVPS